MTKTISEQGFRDSILKSNFHISIENKHVIVYRKKIDDVLNVVIWNKKTGKPIAKTINYQYLCDIEKMIMKY